MHKPNEHVSPRLAGMGGVLIPLTNRKYGLFRPEGFEEATSLKELIKANKGLIAKAFPPNYTPIQRQLQFMHRHQRQCLGDGKRAVSVLANDNWLDVDDFSRQRA